MNFFDQTIFHLAGGAVSGSQLVWAVAVFAAGIVVAFVAASYLGRRLLWPGSAGGNTVYIFLRSLRTKIVFFSLLGSLAVLGVNVLPVVWIILAAGAIAAVAWRSVSEQFTAGFSILWERPFMLGERIKVGEYEGEVERVGLRATTLRSEDRVAIHVPNSYLIAHAIYNRSKTEGGMGLTIPVEVAMGTDSGEAIAALRKAAERNNRVLSSPTPKAFMTGFTPVGLAFELRAWVNNYAEAPWARNELCRAIQSEFQRAGLRFAGAGVTALPAPTVIEDRRPRPRSEAPSRSEERPRAELRTTETRPSRRRPDRTEDKPERSPRRSTRERTRKPKEPDASSRSVTESPSLELPLVAMPVAEIVPDAPSEAEETKIEIRTDTVEPTAVTVPEPSPEAEVPQVTDVPEEEAPSIQDSVAVPEEQPQETAEPVADDVPVETQEPEPVPIAATAPEQTEEQDTEKPSPAKRKNYGRSRRKNPRK